MNMQSPTLSSETDEIKKRKIVLHVYTAIAYLQKVSIDKAAGLSGPCSTTWSYQLDRLSAKKFSKPTCQVFCTACVRLSVVQP